ncbi:putative Hemerythrin [Magnetospirillum sp. XM-1]|uniref:bacteriohemerythrin n=1 Tax=unclassified Magnetospirillum TaxID=2617991 RepID=UPI00073E01C6|nr:MULTISPECIES: bacteriohemerythrin [unclassified Magnetospirillum]ARJ67975.1 hemerythrin [Magnetospirillum sp. ME-1]CUW39450.1 putative Hemerythrin [Magnetospirillum sp. XM-1]
MLELTDDLRIGHPIIDADHQRLIDIINEFNDHSASLNNEKLMHETLKALLSYGREHFAREEKIQRECMYPYHNMHFHEHKALLEQVQDIARTYFIAKTRPLNERSISELNEFLKTWLIGHVKKFDTNLREWVAPSNECLEPDGEQKLFRLPCSDVAALVIDDDATSRTLLVKLLSVMGASVVLEASNAIEGLQLAFSDPVPDIIITDLNMEPMDGFSVVAAVRASQKEYISCIPVIIFSATDDNDLMAKSMAIGATGAFKKPFNPRDLSKFLFHVLKKRPDKS